MQIKITTKNIIIFVLVFLISFAIGVLLELGIFKRTANIPAPASYYKAYAGWYRKVFHAEPVRSENIQLILKALQNYHNPALPTRLPWYEVSFMPYDANSFVLDFGGKIVSKSKNSIVFNKADVSFITNSVQYFGVPVWQGSAVTPRAADFEEVSKFLGLSSLSIKSINNGKCIAVNNACIKLLESLPLLQSQPIMGSANHSISIYFALVKNFRLHKVGSYKPSSNVGALYTLALQNFKLPPYVTYTFLPTTQHNCAKGDGCDVPYFATLQNDMIESLEVKSVKLVYLLLPVVKRGAPQELVTGYLLPFYEINLRGTSNIRNETYVLDLNLIVPALAGK